MIEHKVVRIRLTGGRVMDVFARVLFREPDSLFAELAKRQNFVDCGHRDSQLIRLLVDGLRSLEDEKRSKKSQFIPPEEFKQWRELSAEARYWRLPKLLELIEEASNRANTITVAYHGTLSFGRGGPVSDVNFRRIHRILISGKAWACREVFGRSLNETRDGNTDDKRYTSRFYLVHNFLEQAFDALASHRYKLVSSNCNIPNTSNLLIITNQNQSSDQERCFLHHSQFVFVKNC